MGEERVRCVTQSGRIIARYSKEGADYEFVAVMGAVGDWAAYMGPADWDDEKIYQHGNKCLLSEAAELFPFMNIEYYRR